MKYLITQQGEKPFLTKWFDEANHFISGMTVYDLVTMQYTTDGEFWKNIEMDYL